MPYHYLEDIATADVAFKAWAPSREEMFVSACDALMNVMVEDLNAIQKKEQKTLCARERSVEMLLFQLLQELIFYKDAEQLLLRVPKVEIHSQNGSMGLTALAFGETIDPVRHQLSVDVKAVTLHQFKVEQTGDGWEATVVLDI